MIVARPIVRELIRLTRLMAHSTLPSLNTAQVLLLTSSAPYYAVNSQLGGHDQCLTSFSSATLAETTTTI